MNGSQWFKHTVLAGLVLSSICCAVLTLLVLCKESNRKAGIATLHFNYTEISILDRHTAVTNNLHGCDITTTIPHTASQVQSDAAATASGTLDAMSATFPKNCSIGITQFCIGLAHSISCNDLPLNLSTILPTDVEKIFQINNGDIKAVNGALARASAASIQDCLIAGLILVFVISMFGRFLRLGIHLILGTVCCVPFVVTAIVLYILKYKIQQLPPWIQSEQGEVGKLCLGGLFCAVVMLLLSSIISAIF